jgi:flagellar hook-length control protein FliK
MTATSLLSSVQPFTGVSMFSVPPAGNDPTVFVTLMPTLPSAERIAEVQAPTPQSRAMEKIEMPLAELEALAGFRRESAPYVESGAQSATQQPLRTLVAADVLPAAQVVLTKQPVIENQWPRPAAFLEAPVHGIDNQQKPARKQIKSVDQERQDAELQAATASTTMPALGLVDAAALPNIAPQILLADVKLDTVIERPLRPKAMANLAFQILGDSTNALYPMTVPAGATASVHVPVEKQKAPPTGLPPLVPRAIDAEHVRGQPTKVEDAEVKIEKSLSLEFAPVLNSAVSEKPMFATTSVASLTPTSELSTLDRVDRTLDFAREDIFLDQLAKDIVSAGRRDDLLSFRLQPRNLGTLDVELRNSDAGVSIHFTTAHDAARAILTSAQPRLMDEIRAQGVRVADTQISSERFGQSEHRHGSPDNGSGPPPVVEIQPVGHDTESAEPKNKRVGRFA